MQVSQASSISSDLDKLNPVIIFGVGLVVGSFIGLTGVIISGIAAISYYNREDIIEIGQNARKRLSDNSSTLTSNSWVQALYKLMPAHSVEKKYE